MSHDRQCIDCSKNFLATSNVQKRCPKCQAKNVDRQKNTKPCPICGNPFYARMIVGQTNRRIVTCGRKCANTLNGRINSNVNRNYGKARCDYCQKYFTKRAPHQTHCNETCRSRDSQRRNIETRRKHDRIKVTRQRIGLNIRDETLQTPSKEAKWLWDGIGRWSVKYWPDITECLECNTNVYEHGGNGICKRCYDKMRPRDPEKVKEWQKKSYERLKEKGHIFSRKESRNWIEKAKKKEIPMTPKIDNLLDNLERL